MSKLRCECGAVLSDVVQEDSDKYWGFIVPSGEYHDSLESASEVIASFMESVSAGNEIAWLTEYFGAEYPKDMGISSYISDILTKCYLDLGLSYGRCTSCKSLLVQSEKGSSFYNQYEPSDGVSNGV